MTAQELRRAKRWIVAGYIALALAVIVGLAFGYVDTQRIKHNERETALVVARFCTLAKYQANFWDAVRASTERSLRDPALAPSIRVSFQEFVVELKNGARAARSTCKEKT